MTPISDEDLGRALCEVPAASTPARYFEALGARARELVAPLITEELYRIRDNCRSDVVVQAQVLQALGTVAHEEPAVGPSVVRAAKMLDQLCDEWQNAVKQARSVSDSRLKSEEKSETQSKSTDSMTSVGDVIAWLVIGPTCSAYSDQLASAIYNGDALGWDEKWTRICAERGVPKRVPEGKPYNGTSVEDAIAWLISCELSTAANQIRRGDAAGFAREKGQTR